MVTPTKTYFFQQCTAVDQTETSVQETDSNASAEIVIGQFKTLYIPKWLYCGTSLYKWQLVILQSFVVTVHLIGLIHCYISAGNYMEVYV